MQPDKFTIKSQEAIQAAQRLAHERGNPEITPEHLLSVLLEQEGGIVSITSSSASTRSTPARFSPKSVVSSWIRFSRSTSCRE